MQLLTLLFFMLAALEVMGAAFYPIPSRQDSNNLPEACGQLVTTVTETITSPPATVTVALWNPDQIAASISSGLAIESTYLSEESELAPISAPTVTTTNKLTFTEVVPVVEATLTSSPANSTNAGPYFVSVGPNTTDWSLTDYTPVSSVIIGVTTVTLSPVPSTAVSATTLISSTLNITLTTRRTATSTLHRPFPLSTGGIFTGPKSYGWNATSTISARASGKSGSFSIHPIPKPFNVTTVTSLTTVIVTANVTAYPTKSSISTASSLVETGYGYGFGPGYASPPGYVTDLAKRQICTVVSATIDGQVVTWCNNWDGSTVVPQTSFSTTYTPMPASPSPSPPATNPPPNAPPNVSPVYPPTFTSVPVTSTSSAAATTSCGVSGAFEINFDNLPEFSPSNNDTADFPPIFNPYDHLYWSDGWTYAPPPNEPYPPQSGSHLAEYIPSSSVNSSTTGSPDTGDVPNGALGAGPRNYDSAYWFNIASAYIGCDNGATDPSVTCDFVATGYKFNAASDADEVVVTEHFPQPPCPNFASCQLRQIFFNAQFEGLSALSFYAVVEGQEKIFFIDTMEMGWWNNTCAAGLERAASR